MDKVGKAALGVRTWLTDSALPFWGVDGVDGRGAFQERTDFVGAPDPRCARRMRVQARQLHVFSESAVRGWWPPARDVADQGFEVLSRLCWAPDGQPGFVHALNPDLTPADHTRDAYDHAFGLFAACWYYKASGDPRARVLARDILAFCDQSMAAPVGGGYLESLPPSLPRRSNPHMHMLEACLAGASFCGDAVYLDRARSLVGLFAAHFFDKKTGTYGEYFTEDWRPAPGAEGQVVEPGHHCEWVWLLDWANRLGIVEGEPFIAPLYDWAMAHGLDGGGLAIDECDRQGRQVRTSRRAWVQTELIKAHVTMARRGVAGAADRAAQATLDVLDSYLATNKPGLWIDQIDAEGDGMADWVPASTLYHLLVAFRELMDFAGENGSKS